MFRPDDLHLPGHQVKHHPIGLKNKKPVDLHTLIDWLLGIFGLKTQIDPIESLDHDLVILFVALVRPKVLEDTVIRTLAAFSQLISSSKQTRLRVYPIADLAAIRPI